MQKGVFEERRERFRKLMSENDIPAMLVSHAANRYYLSGFELHDSQCNESSGWLVIAADGREFLFTDPRYTEAAKRVWPEDGLCVYSGGKFATIVEFLKGHGITALAFEPRAMHLYDHDKLREEGLELTSGPALIEELRVIKDADEIRRMDAAIQLNHDLFEYIETRLIPGRTEQEVAWDVERFFKENGAEELAFSTIVGVGPNAALPHAEPADVVVRKNDLVLIDTGCRLERYNSDQTRTFWVGDTPSDRFRQTMDLVRAAQQAAMDVIRPGLLFVDAYIAAWKVFDKAGVAEYFTHGLGHGIGLETHEAPSLSRQAKGTLKEGMVVTVEPGLYYPDWGGIRWEHQVLVTGDGCRIM